MPHLITRLDDTDRTVHIYSHDSQTWAFVAHSDPGQDFLVMGNGRTVSTYTDEPHGAIPEALWNQYMEDVLDV